MVLETSFHDTKEEAEAEGEHFVKCMGRAYEPRYRVYKDGQDWVLVTQRESSCD